MAEWNRNPELNLNPADLGDDDELLELELESLVTPLPIADSTQDFNYDIEGVPIKFPYKAYQSQLDMMKMIILGARNSEHCILESPTGTGKTAAILCSLLAWQHQQQEKELKRQIQIEYENETESAENPESQSKSPIKRPRRTFNNNYSKPTKIYYVSRTHSQLKQVIEQLQKTRYSQTPMATLASKIKTCVNPIAYSPAAGSKVDEICEEMRNAKINDAVEAEGAKANEGRLYPCKYFDYSKDNVHGNHFSRFTFERNGNAWDIEDLKTFGLEHKCCPYFGIRKNLQPDADIIFCTYNNMLNSHIRAACRIDLENSIVVFDEAHNIEDVCRDIASRTISLDQIESVRKELEAARTKPDIHFHTVQIMPLRNLTVAISRMSDWLQEEQKKLYPNNNNYKQIESVLETFTNIGFGPEDVDKLLEDLRTLEDRLQLFYNTGAALFKIDNNVSQFIGRLLHGFQFLFQRSSGEQPEYFNLKNYHVILVKFTNIAGKNEKEHLQLKLICLNPAVTFRDIKNSARTIILTSGSMSPTLSFAAELDMIFQHMLHAPHVLGPDRVFSAVVSHVSNTSKFLNFSATNLSDNVNFLNHSNDLAQIICDLSSLVDYGILIFGPNKNLMERFKKQWEENEDLVRMRELKDIYWEHESTGYQGQDTLDQMLKKYRESAARQRGAILFGFCRGKLSEGVDFPDNEARLVGTIGIPLAPWEAPEVKAKRKFNDQRQNQSRGNRSRIDGRHYLSGSDWYNSNGIRAINQALGRCVRHSKDWGVALALDRRFLYRDNRDCKKYLSTWIKNSMGANGRVAQGPLSSIAPQLKDFLKLFQEPREELNENKSDQQITAHLGDHV